jgi:O-antigen/teichoic acid export membrane protein
LLWGVWGIFAAQAIVLFVFGTYLTFRELWIGSLYPDMTKWKEILRFSLPLVPNGIFAFLYNIAGWCAIIHIGPYDGEDAAYWFYGLYALAGSLMQVSAYMGVRPMQQVWTAEMYDTHKTPEASAVFSNFALRILCVQAFAALLISLFAWELVRVMCDSSFHDAAALMPLFGLYAMINLFAVQMNNTFFITRKTNYNLYCTMYSLPIIFLFMLLLVPRWGITGAVIAQTLAHGAYAGFVYFLTQRFFYVRYPFGKMAMLLGITVLCYFLSFLLCGNGVELSSLTIDEFKALTRWEKMMDAWDRFRWLSILAKMGVMALWGVLVWFSGILSQDDKALVLRVLNQGLQSFTNRWGAHRQ